MENLKVLKKNSMKVQIKQKNVEINSREIIKKWIKMLRRIVQIYRRNQTNFRERYGNSYYNKFDYDYNVKNQLLESMTFFEGMGRQTTKMISPFVLEIRFQVLSRNFLHKKSNIFQNKNEKPALGAHLLPHLWFCWGIFSNDNRAHPRVNLHHP